MSITHTDFNLTFFNSSKKNKCSFSRLVYDDVIHNRKFTYDDDEMAKIYNDFYTHWERIVIEYNHHIFN